MKDYSAALDRAIRYIEALEKAKREWERWKLTHPAELDAS
jgi:hypothetical protein